MMKKDTSPIKDNITELQRTHELIYEQAAILSRSEDIPTAIQGMLSAIGNFVNAERAYIFEDKGTYYSNTFEWCAPGIQPEKDNLRKIDSDTVSPWTDILIHGECIIISEVEAIQEEHPRIYDILKPQNISRVVEAPIMVDNHLIGFLGVDNSPVKTSQRVAETLQILGTFIAITLKNQEGRLESLEQANTALTETNAALRVAYESANQANAAKTNFLSKMSHDIRTPMNGIMGMTTIAIAHIDDKERVLDCLGKISSSSRHLLALINDVLDMSRIESGKMHLEEKPCRLPDILHGLRNIVQADIHAKQLELYIDTVDVINEEIYCDKLRLNQVFLNLLSNAVKYTGPGGIISMRIIQKPGAPAGWADYEFHIKDTGIGMSAEFVKHIFEPFEREKNTTVSGIQGTGLGMAITQNIVDMMNGSISVKSEQGVGTEFIVAVTFRIHAGKKEQQDIPELKNCRALVVDDDFNTCDSVSYMLGQIGMRAEWTLSGKEAVLRTRQAVMRGDDYCVYIIDWLLPDMNGIEVTRRIRKEMGENVPIIVLTAYDWSDVEDEAKEAGVTAFCSKPLFMSELRSCLYSIVNTEEEKIVDSSVDMKFSTGHILLVEDNELNQEIAVEILGDAGFSTDVAENGKIAVEMLAASEPGYYQLVLMDIQMPVMNGYEAAKAIRKLESQELASVPILAMTANAFEEDRQEALRCGMNGHLPKPIDVENLYSTLKEILD